MVRVRRESTAVLLVDVQERLMPVIDGREDLERRIVVFLSGAKALGLPMVWAEQYVKGLGPTVESVAAVAAGKPVGKITFSCCATPEISEILRRINPETVLAKSVLLCFLG